MYPAKIFSSSVKPFELELSRYAGRFARALYVGDAPPFSASSIMNSATVTLVKFGKLLVGVTPRHVIERYRELKDSNPRLIFQIARAQFNPLLHLISEDNERDLAVLDLTSLAGDANDLGRSSFIEPVSWPPGYVSEDDVVCLAGFPGIWRDQVTANELRFHWFSSGATFVRSAGEEKFAVSIHTEQSIVTINQRRPLQSVGGLSGGPVFCWRNDKLLRAELVGFIYEYQDELDLMFVRAARVLNCDGTLIDQIIRF